MLSYGESDDGLVRVALDPSGSVVTVDVVPGAGSGPGALGAAVVAAVAAADRHRDRDLVNGVLDAGTPVQARRRLLELLDRAATEAGRARARRHPPIVTGPVTVVSVGPRIVAVAVDPAWAGTARPGEVSDALRAGLSAARPAGVPSGNVHGAVPALCASPERLVRALGTGARP